MQTPVSPPKAVPGAHVAVLSPSFAAPGFAPEVHRQALTRLDEATGLVPVEYPTTRGLGASARDRADDLNAAFADPEIRAVLATIGGEDQITVIPHLDPKAVQGDPKQVHLGPGPGVDEVHARSLRAALLTGERLEITEPGESEDIGRDWKDPAALSEYGDREPTEPWTWDGPARSVTGRTWGGCVEVVQWILTAGRFPAEPEVLEGGVLLLETSEELIPAREFGWILRSLGERGLLAAVDAVLVARPPTSSFDVRPSPEQRAVRRAEQRDAAIETVRTYNPEAVVVVGVPFGHTRPQWILPYGGSVTVDNTTQKLWADYS